jgi:hypothetical protein
MNEMVFEGMLFELKTDVENEEVLNECCKALD